jgi:PadR family transcriptional regulator PadR
VPKADLLQGTLDLLILRILSGGPDHGWNIATRLEQLSAQALSASQGSLYPALHRLELRGDLRSTMETTDNNRRARVYALTPAGKRRLAAEEQDWDAFVVAMRRVLRGS